MADFVNPEEVAKVFARLTVGSKICHCHQKDAKIDPSIRDQFYATMYPKQDFAFPEPIIRYITKNPTSSKLYQKMIQCCKYFFDQNPILVMSQFYSEYGTDEWGTWFNGNEVDFENVMAKLWINCEINVGNTIISPVYPFVNPYVCNDEKYFGRTIIPKIWKSNIHKLVLWKQTISFKDFIVVAESAKQIVFVNVTIKDDIDGEVVAVEKLVEVCPNLVFMEYNLPLVPKVVTSNTIQELLAIPHFSNVKEFRMNSLSGAMDVDKFFAGIKKNNTTTFRFSFSYNISDDYKLHLKGVMKEIIETENHDYKVPLIGLSAMDDEEEEELSDQLVEVFQRQQDEHDK